MKEEKEKNSATKEFKETGVHASREGNWNKAKV